MIIAQVIDVLQPGDDVAFKSAWTGKFFEGIQAVERLVEHLDRDQVGGRGHTGEARVTTDSDARNVSAVSARHWSERAICRCTRADLCRLVVWTVAARANLGGCETRFLNQPAAQERMRTVDAGVDDGNGVSGAVEINRMRAVGTDAGDTEGERRPEQLVFAYADSDGRGRLELR